MQSLYITDFVPQTTGLVITPASNQLNMLIDYGKLLRFLERLYGQTFAKALHDCIRADIEYALRTSPGDRGKGDALLVAVIRRCPLEIVDILIELGFDVNHKTPQGFTALSAAVSIGNIELVNALIEKGALISADVLQQARRRHMEIKPATISEGSESTLPPEGPSNSEGSSADADEATGTGTKTSDTEAPSNGPESSADFATETPFEPVTDSNSAHDEHTTASCTGSTDSEVEAETPREPATDGGLTFDKKTPDSTAASAETTLEPIADGGATSGEETTKPSFDSPAPMPQLSTDIASVLIDTDTGSIDSEQSSDSTPPPSGRQSSEGSSAEGTYGGHICIYTDSFEMIAVTNGLPENLELHSFVFVNGEWLLNWCCMWVQDFDSNACLEIVNKYIDELLGSVTTLTLRTTTASIASKPPVATLPLAIAPATVPVRINSIDSRALVTIPRPLPNPKPADSQYTLVVCMVVLAVFCKFVWARLQYLRMQPKDEDTEDGLLVRAHTNETAANVISPLQEEMTAVLAPDEEFNSFIMCRQDIEIPVIIRSAARGDTESVKLYVNSGGDLSVRTSHGLGLLHAAALAKSCSFKIATCLLKHPGRCADVNLAACDRTSPLMIAAEFRNVKLVKYLLRNGASVGERRASCNTNSLMVAAARGNIGVFRKMLLGKNLQTDAPYVDNVILNAHNAAGQTALDIAVQNGYVKIVELLCRAGIDRHAVDDTGSTARHYAETDAAIVNIIDTVGV